MKRGIGYFTTMSLDFQAARMNLTTSIQQTVEVTGSNPVPPFEFVLTHVEADATCTVCMDPNPLRLP